MAVLQHPGGDTVVVVVECVCGDLARRGGQHRQEERKRGQCCWCVLLLCKGGSLWLGRNARSACVRRGEGRLLKCATTLEPVCGLEPSRARCAGSARRRSGSARMRAGSAGAGRRRGVRRRHRPKAAWADDSRYNQLWPNTRTLDGSTGKLRANQSHECGAATRDEAESASDEAERRKGRTEVDVYATSARLDETDWQAIRARIRSYSHGPY